MSHVKERERWFPVGQLVAIGVVGLVALAIGIFADGDKKSPTPDSDEIGVQTQSLTVTGPAIVPGDGEIYLQKGEVREYFLNEEKRSPWITIPPNTRIVLRPSKVMGTIQNDVVLEGKPGRSYNLYGAPGNSGVLYVEDAKTTR